MDSVSICNMALLMLGIPSITSFDDSNNNAKLCKAFFPVLRDRCLRDHVWSFATAAQELQILSETSYDPEYEYVCGLPVDVIRVIGLIGGSKYRRIGKKILVKHHPVKVEYIRRITDAEEFDATFVEALQYLLAGELGMANTRDAQLINMYRQEYEKRLAVARAIDSQENIYSAQPGSRHSNWLASRRGAGVDIGERTVWVEGTEGIQIKG